MRRIVFFVLVFILQSSTVNCNNHGCQVLLEWSSCPTLKDSSNATIAQSPICDGWMWERRWIAVEESCLSIEGRISNCSQHLKVTLTNLELVFVQFTVKRLLYSDQKASNETIVLLQLESPFLGEFDGDLDVSPSLRLHSEWISETIRQEDAMDDSRRRQLERAVDTDGDIPAIVFMDFLKLLLVVSSLAGISFLFCCTFVVVSK
ncbi:uncharacterized protein LOC126559126 [Anopheles maculipalpis]|uniref:uncharacterized protein LOC126559126 n=1 Tax=Anopheles maculipalpis TaxID=1496333 RepID=UPI002158B4D9|nr:uncharacterized protein LOC126559126 [Anopheles maculipalpis]